jgi:CxxC-x17-CxxC domain-containing protein
MGFNDGGRGGFGGGGGRPMEFHKATCSECKKECEVPFKPTEGKPVYCKECYAKMPKPNRL